MTYVRNYWEVNFMPRRDGTGPMGEGSGTGRGLGICASDKIVKHGVACRRGFGRSLGRGYAANQGSTEVQKKLFQEQKEIYQNRLKVIDAKLENL